MALSLKTLDAEIQELKESSESGVVPTDTFMLPNVANVRSLCLRADLYH